MPINGLQTRFAQVGVIRLGQQVPTGRTNARGVATMRPEKLETFRFTSPSKPLIERVAELYGGDVKPWQHPAGPQWEVITKAREIPVFVPPQVIDPNYELWGNKYKARQCDGVTEAIRAVPCMCRAQFGDDFTINGPAGQVCKPTTRMSLMLAELESFGSWKLESHGWNFASEMPMMAGAVEHAAGPIPGRLELQVRERNLLRIVNGAEKVEPRKFMVPVVHFDDYTPREAFGAVEGGTKTAINGGGRQAIASSTVEQPDWLALIAEADTADAVNNLMDRMRGAGVRDPQVVEAWKAKAASFSAPAPAQASARPASAAPAAPVDAQVLEAEPEPNAKQVWGEILDLAQERGWNMPALTAKYEKQMGFDHRDDRSDGFALARFRDAVVAGEVK